MEGADSVAMLSVSGRVMDFRVDVSRYLTERPSLEPTSDDADLIACVG